jgi:peptide-methionine (R)-S-oxide reductase
VQHRRAILTGAGIGGAGLFGWSGRGAAATPTRRFEVEHSQAEWRRRLTPEQFRVLRDHGTERAGTSPLDKESRRGLFHCAGCDRPLFDSAAKYDSRTGWPSFWAPIAGAVGTSIDRTVFWQTRTEVHCSRCGGHLGHVFDDGPAPTGKRYCMNGIAMTFRPAAAGPPS